MFKQRSLKLAAVLALLVGSLLTLAVPAFAQSGLQGGDRNPETVPGEGQKIGYVAFTGAPTIDATKERIWAWNENVSGQNILHLRTTTGGAPHTFTGVVNTSGVGNFYDLALVNADSDDSTSTITYNQFSFTIVNNGSAQTGLDVAWSGRWVSLDLYIDGYARPAHVLYGASAKAARQNPLIVTAGDKGLLAVPLSALDGTTKYVKNVADGYFLYRDTKSVYHLRLTTLHSGDIEDYQGRINADAGQFTAIKIFRGDPRDFYTLIGSTLLKFRFVTNGYQDGLDWKLTQNTGMTLTLRTTGHMAAPNIWLGSSDPTQPGIKAFTFRLVP